MPAQLFLLFIRRTLKIEYRERPHHQSVRDHPPAHASTSGPSRRFGGESQGSDCRLFGHSPEKKTNGLLLAKFINFRPPNPPRGASAQFPGIGGRRVFPTDLATPPSPSPPLL